MVKVREYRLENGKQSWGTPRFFFAFTPINAYLLDTSS